MSLADDLLKGLGTISKWSGLTERELVDCAKLGTLPLFKVGKLWLARKSELEACLSGVRPMV